MFQLGGEPICLILCTFWNMKDIGLFLPWCSDRILNVLSCDGWKCTLTPAIASRITSSQATVYTHCTSHSTVALACPYLTLCPATHSGWRRSWLCHPVPMQCPLAQCCLSAAPCFSLPHTEPEPLKLTASFDSVFSFSYQWPYPT